ncbi:MAG: ATP-binding cassette domain-containing protein [Chloroflexi bacterium]|nr:ATP-binding cassette domain-containing protein [Chloroflexota bacterium]
MLTGTNLIKDFRVRLGLFRGSATLRAVDRVSITINEGETVALVGESGSGKSTLGRVLLGLLPPTSGDVQYRRRAFASLQRDEAREFRAQVQAVFQDTSASLNPRRTIADSIESPLMYNRRLSRAQARNGAAQLLERVGLDPKNFAARFPHQLSGGQRQRVGLARALASQPRLIVADEPVSALDVSVRAQILKLMQELQAQEQLAYLFITHDLGVARLMANRVMVMYLGAVVEEGFAADVFARPSHPYTHALTLSAPMPDPARPRPARRLAGEIPSPLAPPSGCHFHPRCPFAQDVCKTDAPPVCEFTNAHRSACHFAEQVRAAVKNEK